MHQLQQQILSRLISKPDCRYRDIKPKDVEGNLFMYHLRQLTGGGLIEKTPTGRYGLTVKGLQLADKLSLKNLKPRVQPKIVCLLAVQNQQKEWLLYKRRRQPFHGLVGFPYGKIHLGETIQAAGERELREKTGLLADLTHAGDAYLTVYQNDELLVQMFCHVFVGTDPRGKLVTDSPIGECFWQKLSTIDQHFMPGFKEIVAHVESRKHFFDEITVTINH